MIFDLWPWQGEGVEGGEGDKQMASETQQRTPEDLATYLKFFPELIDFEEVKIKHFGQKVFKSFWKNKQKVF